MDDDNNQWELSKENIQPIKQGRSVGALMAALDHNSQHILNRERNEYEAELRMYSGPDPLDVWHRYALWVEQSYPKGGKTSNLKPLLEKCFTAINASSELVDKYRNDPRFLQLWLKYSTMCNNPLEVFQVLEAKAICTELASFYENWASEMEVSGHMKKSDIIFQKGLVKAKDNTLRLSEAHKSFQTRMFMAAMAKRQEDGSEDEIDEASSSGRAAAVALQADEDGSQPRRVALSALKTVQKNRAPVERVAGAVLGGAGRVAVDQTEVPLTNVQRGKVNIYQDENAIGGDGVFLVPAAPATSRLPPLSQLDKENNMAAGKWSSSSKKHSSTASASSETLSNVSFDHIKQSSGKPSIIVYEDENVPRHPRHFIPQSNNVLREWKSSAVLQQAEDTIPLFIEEPFDPKVRPQYDKHRVYQGTEEFSFEELRSLQYFKQVEEEKKQKEQKRQVEEKSLKLKEELKQKDAEIDSMKSILAKHEELIQKLMQQQETAPTAKQETSGVVAKVPHTPLVPFSSQQPALMAAVPLLQPVDQPNSLFEDSWVAVNRTAGNNTMLAGNTSVLPQQLLDESLAAGPIPAGSDKTTAPSARAPTSAFHHLSMANISCAPPDISELSILEPLMAGDPNPAVIFTAPSPDPLPVPKLKGLSIRLPSTVHLTSPAECSEAPQHQIPIACSITKPKVLATDGYRKPGCLDNSDQRSMMASPTINTKEAQRFMTEVWSTSLNLSKPSTAVWDNVLDDEEDNSLMPPPQPPLPQPDELLQVYRDDGSQPSAPEPFTIYCDDPNAPPVVVNAGPPLVKRGLSLRPSVGPAPEGSSGSRGLSERLAGLSERSDGLSKRPACFSERPFSLSEQPTGLSQKPAAFTERSTEVMTSGSPQCVTTGSTVKSSSQIAAVTAASDVSPTPVQDENCPPPDYVPRAVPPRPRVGVLQPVLDLPYAEAGSDDKEGGASTEMDVDQDLKGIRPLAPSPPLIDPTAGDTTCSEYTMKLPGNLAAFADISHVASTPGAWSLSRVPQPRHDTDECTVALMPGFFKGAPRATFRQLRQTDEDDDDDLRAMLPPPPSSLPSAAAVMWGHQQPALHPQGHPSAVDEEHQQPPSLEEGGPGVRAGQLSTIMEGSAEHTCAKSTSSVSSCVFTTTAKSHLHTISEVSMARTSLDPCKSGYTADRSSMTTIPCTSAGGDVFSADAAGANTPATFTAKAAAPMADDSFDPDKLSDLLMNMSPSKAFSGKTDAPVAAASAATTELRLPGAGTTEGEQDDARVQKTETRECAPSLDELLSVAGGDDGLDPFSEDLLQLLLCRLSLPLQHRAGFMLSNTKLPLVKIKSQLSLGSDLFHVRRLRGQGAYAKVFQASTLDPMNVTALLNDDGEEDDGACDENDESQMILKVQKPACPWEFYICHELRERLKASNRPPNVLDSVMRINRGYFFNTGSILVTQFHRYGTLLDVLNGYKSKGLNMSEDLALYFMIEILVILENVHACEIIHADIKPDNFLVRDVPSINHFATTPEKMFEGCPRALKLIDFGRSIDLRILPKEITFKRKVTTEGFTCCEMQAGRPWTYQPDLYGAAATAHTMLWGTYMSVTCKAGNWELQGVKLKRYWQQDAWQSVFSSLLNAPSCDNIPDLAQVRKSLQHAFFHSGKATDFKTRCTELSAIMTQSR